MSGKKSPPGGPCQPGADETEQSQTDESAGIDMSQAMGRMMANCPCGPEMMTKMAGLMGTRPPSQPAEPAPKKKD